MLHRSRCKPAGRMLTVGALSLAFLVAPAHAQEGSQWGSGKNLYDKVCGLCHAPEVGVGTVIVGRDLPEDYIRSIVRNGFNGMPAFPASFIDDESLAQVSEYLSSVPFPDDQP